MGIGRFIAEKLAEGLPPRDILPLVKAKFPGARTTINSIRWYKTNSKRRPNKPRNEAAPSKKYELPSFLVNIISQKEYTRWLGRRSIQHLRRDRKRGNAVATNAAYKTAIHAAVSASNGLDYYTGEMLDWKLVSKYDNVLSNKDKRKYKSLFALLPTVDDVDDGLGEPNFQICGWRTNDAKADLTEAELVEFCRRIIAHWGHGAADPHPLNHHSH